MGTADDPRWLKESRRQLKRRQQRRPPQPGASLFQGGRRRYPAQSGFPPRGKSIRVVPRKVMPSVSCERGLYFLQRSRIYEEHSGLRPATDRAPLAGILGKEPFFCRRKIPREAQVLSPHRVPLSLRARACTWAIPAPIRPWTSSPVSGAWRATTSCSPSATTPLACPRKTTPSKPHHPAKVTAKNIPRFRSQLKRLGFSFDYVRRSVHHRPELLQVDPVDFPQALQNGPGL